MHGMGADGWSADWLSSQVVWGAVWTGLAVVTVALLVLMRTRWGQSRPLRKYAVLSVWAHLLMATYAMTVPIVVGGGVVEEEPVFTISTVDDYEPDAPPADAAREPLPWERFPAADTLQPDAVMERANSTLEPAAERPAAQTADTLPDDFEAPDPLLSEPQQPDVEIAAPHAPLGHGDITAVAPIDAPAATRRAPTQELVPQPGQLERADKTAVESPAPERFRPTSVATVNETLIEDSPTPRTAELPSTADPAPSIADLVDAHNPSHERPLANAAAVAAPLAPVLPSAEDLAAVDAADAASNRVQGEPGIHADRDPPHRDDSRGGPQPATGQHVASAPVYRLRTAPNRLNLTQAHGGTPESEAAVEAALKWLANNQSADGRWNPARLEGGRELAIGGRDRKGSGAQADTGVTGLSVLAFLGAGHTHFEGDHRDTVRRGLEFLLNSQAADGNLAGAADTFAAMYCHAMASLALCEAYGMTRDDRLEPAIRGAVTYTLGAQHPVTGGWRYRPGDLGDTSQLGWQVMALRSAELAGIDVPEGAREGAVRFLKSVSSGAHGGLAAYRPGELASRPMTAEALFCRQILGMRRDNPAGAEAAVYLAEQLPGDGQPNLYYWYYSTLALYQWQGEHWQRWNLSLQKTLVESQVKAGAAAGSWPPESVWSGYGGRAYSTALGALCLEVYYRFLPLYADTAAAGSAF